MPLLWLGSYLALRTNTHWEPGCGCNINGRQVAHIEGLGLGRQAEFIYFPLVKLDKAITGKVICFWD